MYEFQARLGTDQEIFARLLPCRCRWCRNLMSGADPIENVCVIIRVTGFFSRTKVLLKKTLTDEQTKEKKRADKEKRRLKNAERVKELAEAGAELRANLGGAPNTTAAVMADDMAPSPIPESGGSARSGGDAEFARMYGAQDAFAVAQATGKADFRFQYASGDNEGESAESEDEED